MLGAGRKKAGCKKEIGTIGYVCKAQDHLGLKLKPSILDSSGPLKNEAVLTIRQGKYKMGMYMC